MVEKSGNRLEKKCFHEECINGEVNIPTMPSILLGYTPYLVSAESLLK
jgi:hypothetical protein